MAATFVDHYALLGCAPSAPLAELKKAYYERLREYHPDKRPNSAEERGKRMTQALNEAWDILQDSSKREVYDYVWHREMESRVQQRPRDPVEDLRRDGNELYKAGQVITKEQGDTIGGAARALQKYKGAIEKYSHGLEISPGDHRLCSNRALCFAAVKDWTRCREDAERATQLKPDSMKGWFLYVKALWKEGSTAQAKEQIDVALRQVPDAAELQALKREIEIASAGGAGARSGASRNVSPACTPPPGSRLPTPPRLNRPMPPSHLAGSRYHRSQQSRSPTAYRNGADHTWGADQTWGDTVTFGNRTAPAGASPSYGGTVGSCGASVGGGTFGGTACTFGAPDLTANFGCTAGSRGPSANRSTWTEPRTDSRKQQMTPPRGRRESAEQTTPPRQRSSSFRDMVSRLARTVGVETSPVDDC